MRIGVFTDSYKPYVSGVVTSVESFSREYRRLGHEVYIFAPGYPGSRAADDYPVFRFHSIPTPTNPGYRLAVPLSARLRENARRLKLDVIHTHSPFLLGSLGARLGKSMGIPVVFTYHTLYDQYIHYIPGASDSLRRFVIGFTSRFCNRCDAVITPSEGVRELLRQRGVRREIQVIPTGIVPDRFAAGRGDLFRRKAGIGPDQKVLLYTGRLGKEKNLDILLDAFGRIHRRMSDTVLLVVGGGPDEPRLRQAIADGRYPGVILTGRLQSQNLADAYRAADLFFFASTTETQGLVLLEAMSVGLPVVAAESYGSLDLITNGHNGFLVKPRAQELATAALTVLSDTDLLEAMKAAARRRAEEFSIDKMAAKAIGLYEKLRRQSIASSAG